VAYLNDPILIDIFEHLVQDGRDNLLRTTGDGESDRGGVEIARESLSGENGLSLEEIPFSFVLDKETRFLMRYARNQCNEGKL
jgi:hypothetical protein